MKNIEELRKVEVLNPLTNEWEVKKLRAVEKGNSFRMFEPDGSPVVDKDNVTIFIASEDAYFDEQTQLWHVIVDPLEENK